MIIYDSNSVANQAINRTVNDDAHKSINQALSTRLTYQVYELRLSGSPQVLIQKID